MMDFHETRVVECIQKCSVDLDIDSNYGVVAQLDAPSEKENPFDRVSKCAFFSNQQLDHLTIERLGGWSNTSYKLKFGCETFVMRLNRKNSFLGIDREAEKNNSGLAEKLGIGSRIVYSEPDLQIARYIENRGVVLAEDFQERATLSQVIATLKRLHFSGFRFASDLNPYERLLTVYEKVCRKGAIPLPDQLHRTIQFFRPIFVSTKLQNIGKVPCHNDTTPYNMLHTEEGVQLVDWEHSANNDPAWDLAYLSAEAGFSEELDEQMIRLYQPIDTDEFVDRFYVYKPLTHLWIVVWLYTQIYSHNEVLSIEEFKNIANERLSLCIDLCDKTAFKKAMQRLRE